MGPNFALKSEFDDKISVLEEKIKSLEEKLQKKEDTAIFEIQSGSEEIDCDEYEEDEEDFWQYRRKIDFPIPFSSTPQIFLSLKSLEQGNDSSDKSYSSWSISASKITQNGFTLKVETYWPDDCCKLEECEVNWLAYLKN